MTRTVRLALLGPFEARWSDGETLALSGKKIQGLVAYLAIESDRAHAREELATLLWSEAGEERARHNLRQALSKIRRGCESLIVSEDDTLRLDREHCEVDVHEFWRQLDTEEPDELRRGLDLYRHDLLEGLVVREEAFDDWLRDARTRLRDLACGGFERLADALTALDRLDEAIAVLRRRLVFDPACEQAHRGLMELLARTGRRSLPRYRTGRTTSDSPRTRFHEPAVVHLTAPQPPRRATLHPHPLSRTGLRSFQQARHHPRYSAPHP